MIRRIHLESDAGTLSSCLFPKGAAQNRFILVIDDSPTVRKIIEVCLSRKGFEVESYPDGIEALRTFTNDPQKRIPHLVIVDIDLPRMNGYEIARFLRAKPQWKQTVIVMLSRHTGILEQLKARLAGTQAYITKPFTTEMITEVVIRLLGLSSVSIEGQAERDASTFRSKGNVLHGYKTMKSAFNIFRSDYTLISRKRPMRKTQYEILLELRQWLGQSETTEHLIDWVLDLQETRDLLLKHLGKEYTFTLLEAIASSSADLSLQNLVLCEPTPQDLKRSSLN